jgi:hypothetical protein
MLITMATNQEVGRLIGNGASIRRCRSLLNNIEFNLSFGGPRSDHYDVTPTTPDDMQAMLRANNGLQNWIALPVAIQVGDRWIAAGLNTLMHGSRIGGGNPGPQFPSLSNNPPPAGQRWPQGGHVCLYFQNSSGGAGDGTNRHARAEANQRAGTPNVRGRQARAACHEASFRSVETPPAPQATLTEVNYEVEIIRGPINIRPGPGTNQNPPAGTASNPATFRIDAEQEGPDNSIPAGRTMWGRVAEGQHRGRWLALRLTNRLAEAPPTLETVRVQAGDTLFRIGQRTNRRWQDIACLNDIPAPYIIRIGQELFLP